MIFIYLFEEAKKSFEIKLIYKKKQRARTNVKMRLHGSQRFLDWFIEEGLRPENI